MKTFRQLHFSITFTEEKEKEEKSEEFFGIYRFVAHEHSVAELIFHIIKGGEGLIEVERMAVRLT